MGARRIGRPSKNKKVVLLIDIELLLCVIGPEKLLHHFNS